MSQLPTSNVTQDYLKAIYAAVEWGGPATSVSALAARMGVSASTASETVRRLADEGLVHHERYGGISLTGRGRQAALAMVRRHRLIETLLVEHLGYEWDEVHDEAEVLEHAVSDLLVERIDRLLGHPVRDPHGDPIPTAGGEVTVPPTRPLAQTPAGEGGRVVRISDAEPQVLRHLADVGVRLDTHVAVLEARPYVGTTLFTVTPPGESAGEPVELGDPAVAAVWVTA
ncbi:metal-dependent transcriptional regulator [Georgenia satyanarayanai]|uniref:metal-dependent transcriptional regulator n=1 Tax=Georgenia satyanarayanai TaxID=860221 RepID=UPI00203B406D|nr:metal-dependent transcriptional regulator [Georgenia satyanarayanai]MCM3661546.1 metal-dependent transcriptional regulator [Georgenia satyanarayanai]